MIVLAITNEAKILVSYDFRPPDCSEHAMFGLSAWCEAGKNKGRKPFRHTGIPAKSGSRRIDPELIERFSTVFSTVVENRDTTSALRWRSCECAGSRAAGGRL
jgi:hypothetical protein